MKYEGAQEAPRTACEVPAPAVSLGHRMYSQMESPSAYTRCSEAKVTMRTRRRARKRGIAAAAVPSARERFSCAKRVSTPDQQASAVKSSCTAGKKMDQSDVT